MAYPGNPELSPQAQERVMSAFKQVIEKLQKGNREEALIGLEFVLRLDPAYSPAKNLHKQVASGSTEIDLNDIVSQLSAPTTTAINNLVIEAMEDFNNRDFDSARSKVEQVLLDLPGHNEARDLLRQIEEATKGENQVSLFLSQARDALEQGNSQEAANFVMMAQALDPHHRDIAPTIAQINNAGDMSLSQAGFSVTKETTDEALFGSPDDGPPEFGGPADFDAAAEASDLFAEVEVPAVPTPSDPVTYEQPATTELSADEVLPESQDYYEDDGNDVSDLFDAGPTTFDEESVDDELDPDDPRAVIPSLLTKGGDAAAEDNFPAAIDAWSRILLIDHTHEVARDRIEHIRHAKDELDRRIEPMLSDSEAALASGELTLASDFIDRALTIFPKHVAATRLKEKIYRDSHPAGESDMPDLEDELFTDAFSATTDFGAAAEMDPASLEGKWRAPEKPKRRAAWQIWALVGTVGVLIVVGALWLAGVFVPEDQGPPRMDVVARVLAEADELFNKKQVQEAILHLEQNSDDDQFQVRIDKRLEKYRAAVATPVPTPIPEGLVVSRDFLAEGRWLAAYQRCMSELAAHPNDAGLEELRTAVLAVEPEAANLYAVIKNGDHPAAISITKDLMEKWPVDQDLPALYHQSLFNAGVAELRAINLDMAETYLKEFDAAKPEDAEVRRILAFIETYKGRPVDMQLEIFVGSIIER
jgi:tetratricopeptide (TPR) repeat protein